MRLCSINENNQPDINELEILIRSLADKVVYLTHVNNLAGGLGDKITYQEALDMFGIEALAKGALVELEHTDNVLLALEIAIDHLAESDKYYDYLEKMEDEMMASESIQFPGGFPGSSTGGMRTMPDKLMPDEEDIENEGLEDIDDEIYYAILQANKEVDKNFQPKEVSISDDEIEQQAIMKEPDDHLHPMTNKGPGD